MSMTSSIGGGAATGAAARGRKAAPSDVGAAAASDGGAWAALSSAVGVPCVSVLLGWIPSPVPGDGAGVDPEAM